MLTPVANIFATPRDIGFPDTPRKKAINDSAQKQAAEKEWQVQRDKRYRKRRLDEGDRQQ